MNLLMITRKIDKDDWLAGHSYEWAKNISEQLKTKNAKLKIICLEKGNTEGLDAEVYSLGKELGNSRWKRFWKFQRLAAKLVKEVDGVFAHQNPEYALWVSPWTFLYRKKLVSWYTHKAITWRSRLMLVVSDKVLTASEKSFRIRSPKVQITGHGIDVEKFTRPRLADNVAEGFHLPRGGLKASVTSGIYGSSEDEEIRKFKIVSVGRISPVKDLETLILAVRNLVRERKVENVHLDIIGGVGLTEHKNYLQSLEQIVGKSQLEDYISFKGSVPHSRLPEIYQNADLCVNLSQTGSLDKAVLEAMACECPIITSNEAFFEMLRSYEDLVVTQSNDSSSLSKKISQIIELKKADKETLTANLRNIVVTDHSLDKLAEKIVSAF